MATTRCVSLCLECQMVNEATKMSHELNRCLCNGKEGETVEMKEGTAWKANVSL